MRFGAESTLTNCYSCRLMVDGNYGFGQEIGAAVGGGEIDAARARRSIATRPVYRHRCTDTDPKGSIASSAFKEPRPVERDTALSEDLEGPWKQTRSTSRRTAATTDPPPLPFRPTRPVHVRILLCTSVTHELATVVAPRSCRRAPGLSFDGENARLAGDVEESPVSRYKQEIPHELPLF
ncbi:hypothetical protein AAG570_003422 [Ranatra chinensis]|uniref:Uncharacterized protein n=1 Tax=Ranatra chinensis TaxID=642074 RepID=A0ABD0Y490_9HEMI